MEYKLKDVGPRYEEQGGHLLEPKGMALKILEEAIEVCIASGASHSEIGSRIYNELQKRFLEKKTLGGLDFNQDDVEKELADVLILSTAYVHMLSSDIDVVVNAKMQINDTRKWYPDASGVLKRDKS